VLFVVVASPVDVGEVEGEFSEDGGEGLEDLDAGADNLRSDAVGWYGCDFVDGFSAGVVVDDGRHGVAH